MHFPRLRYLQVRNAAMNAPQLKELITSHRETVKEYELETDSEFGDTEPTSASLPTTCRKKPSLKPAASA